MYKDSVQYSASIEIEVFNDTRGMPVVFDPQGFYKTRWSYPSGTDFRYMMTDHHPAYVYAFASDSSGTRPERIFPLRGVSPVLDYSDSTIAWPGEFLWIRMDDTVGTDYLIVLYSKEELDIAAIERRFAIERGSFPERVARAVGPDFIPYNEVLYGPAKMEFSAISTNPKAVFGLLLAIEHHAAGTAPFEVLPEPAPAPSGIRTLGRDFIKQAIQEQGRCLNVAITQRSGNVALFARNGIAYQDIPANLTQTLDRMTNDRMEIRDIHISEEGKWVVVGDTITWAGIETSLENEIRNRAQRGETINSVSFNDKGEWILITDRSYNASNTEIQNWLRNIITSHGNLRTACVTDDGIVAIFERGMAGRGNIPGAFWDALINTNLRVHRVKISGEAWFFSDNNGNFQYSM